MHLSSLAGAGVAIWGLGREGFAAYRRLRREYPAKRLLILDDARLNDATAAVLAADPLVEVRTGNTDATVATAAPPAIDVIIKSPGISRYRPSAVAAREHGCRFTSVSDLWLAGHQDQTVIGVTGTKGKSTTASLIAHLLEGMGRHVGLGGNLGEPLFDLEDRLGPGVDTWVVELSSYQTADLESVPPIAVILNLFPEHYDWHGTTEVYYRDKLNLLRGGRQVAVLNGADERLVKRTRDVTHKRWFNTADAIHEQDGRLYDGDRELSIPVPFPLLGAHNLVNLSAALTVLRECSFQPTECLPGVVTFSPLPHRLEVVAECDGVTWVDDSISTTPESTLAALRAFRDRSVTLLLGGFDRSQDYRALALEVHCDHLAQVVITLPQNGPRIAAELRQASEQPEPQVKLFEASDLVEAVAIARAKTSSGGVVLLSPAAPSYGLFTNFEQRGQRFAQLAAARD